MIKHYCDKCKEKEIPKIEEGISIEYLELKTTLDGAGQMGHKMNKVSGIYCKDCRKKVLELVK